MDEHVGPILVVAACIIKEQYVLLARRHQPSLPEAHLKWELPGGRVEFGESPEEAIEREIREELGIDIEVDHLLPHVQSNIYHRANGTTIHTVVLAFESVLPRGSQNPKPNDPAVSEVRWIALPDLPKYDTLPGTERFIESLLLGI